MLGYTTNFPINWFSFIIHSKNTWFSSIAIIWKAGTNIYFSIRSWHYLNFEIHYNSYFNLVDIFWVCLIHHEITYKIKNTFILSVDFMTKVHYSTRFERESVGGNVLAISCFTWTFSGYACIGISALIIILHLATLNTLEWLSYQKD